MYGDYQTSKLHYMCQAYWMPDFLPKRMLKNCIVSNGNKLSVIVRPNINIGKNRAWYRSGAKYSESISEATNGSIVTKTISWHENGLKLIESELKDGHFNGKFIQWNDKGNKFCEIEFKEGVKIKDHLEPSE